MDRSVVLRRENAVPCATGGSAATASAGYGKPLFMANNADFAYAGYYNNLGQALSEMGEEDSAFFYFER